MPACTAVSYIYEWLLSLYHRVAPLNINFHPNCHAYVRAHICELSMKEA